MSGYVYILSIDYTSVARCTNSNVLLRIILRCLSYKPEMGRYILYILARQVLSDVGSLTISFDKPGSIAI